MWLSLYALAAYSQQTDSLVRKLDSLSKRSDSAGGQVNDIHPAAYTEKTSLDLKTYFVLLGSDFKQQFTAPFHMTKKDWKKAGVFTLAMGGLAFADEPVQRLGLRIRNSSQSVRDVSHFITNFGANYEVYTLLGLGTYGLAFKDEKVKTTTLLASQAYVTSLVMESCLKLLSGRQRPSYYDAHAIEAEPLFHGPFYKGSDVNGTRINSAFPSGHTTVAFSAATVYAMEYRNRPLVPIVAYSAATLIGLSRITENKHWITDVVAGAFLGMVTGHQVVNNYHRFSKLQASKQKKGAVALNISYNYGQLQPGIVYTFR
ncbi:MAG: phosphatase family protein [Flaviaesturariibacter sp.]|nr:phosphatase family protein [Flaviaesturariibacter sp.]